MIQLNAILVPTDGSEYAHKAMIYALEFAKQFKSTVHVLMVADDRTLRLLEWEYVPVNLLSDMESMIEKQTRESLEKFVQEFPNFSLKMKVLKGDPVHEIVNYAKEQNIDMIIMGTHGRSGLNHMLVGSTTEKVMRHAPCPVLTVKPHQHDMVVN